jgi:hypothetical protein
MPVFTKIVQFFCVDGRSVVDNKRPVGLILVKTACRLLLYRPFLGTGVAESRHIYWISPYALLAKNAKCADCHGV